ncbi:MAG TPA: group II intron reverse transcriptase/maturase [Thermoanaerobaculaceae bacterium]|nr:group II intron reverse transcriptase/maturase [Thermoanaerobaculaceae bacterium]HPS79129.1 group II intron reverse transcriptase/maturase [Thermoanaerobaculaceae bacterium]
MEGRGLAKGNLVQRNGCRTQRRGSPHSELERVREVAKRDKQARFSALWHHVTEVDRLREAFLALKRESAPGVDAVTWREYEVGLESRVSDLASRLTRGAYRARPVRRVYIPKPDGRQRPIGVPALEDKIVQRATADVLNAIYEVDFLGFSYGFRLGRGPHHALDALAVGLKHKRVNWVLDADIRGFYDAIDHEWLVKFVEHRIADRRVVRHIQKWLAAGVLEDGVVRQEKEGTPQGGSISPLLANIYLHYVFDLWVQHWRRRHAHGDVIVVRFADDLVVGFEHRMDAERFQGELRERLAKFNLELHADKTRLIEFGQHAETRRRHRGEGKPETFDFLGFTHICAKTRRGWFTVLRQTMAKRMRGKLQALKGELRRRGHLPVPTVGRWLRSVLTGHYRYYGVPNNWHALSRFHYQLGRLWYRALRRRSQRTRLNWDRMQRLIHSYLPYPRIMHPYPEQRLRVTTRGKSSVR